MEGLPSVTKDPSVSLRSTWRPAIGKPLTNHAIARYILAGRYGESAQRRAQQREERLRKARKRVQLLDNQPCHSCKQTTPKNRYYSKPFFAVFCPLCVAVARSDRDKELEHKRSWRERMLDQYA